MNQLDGMRVLRNHLVHEHSVATNSHQIQGPRVVLRDKCNDLSETVEMQTFDVGMRLDLRSMGATANGAFRDYQCGLDFCWGSSSCREDLQSDPSCGKLGSCSETYERRAESVASGQLPAAQSQGTLSDSEDVDCSLKHPLTSRARCECGI